MLKKGESKAMAMSVEFPRINKNSRKQQPLLLYTELASSHTADFRTPSPLSLPSNLFPTSLSFCRCMLPPNLCPLAYSIRLSRFPPFIFLHLRFGAKMMIKRQPT